MSQVNPELLDTDMTTVDGSWQFDLQFYRDMGLDLADLEDPSYEAAIPRMRRAAKLVVETANHASDDHKQRAIDLLGRSHQTVRSLMRKAMTGLNYEGLSEIHPAAVAWQDRYSQRLEPARQRSFDDLFSQKDWIELVLVRPILPESDPEYIVKLGRKFKPVTLPNANYYETHRPETVAAQLVLARTAITFDI